MKSTHASTRRIFALSLFLGMAVFTGCSTADIGTDAEGGSGAEVSGVTSISGTISNYSLGGGRMIRLTYWGNSAAEYTDFGSGTVASDGSFTIPKLYAVPDALMSDLGTMYEGVTVSNPSARINGGFVLRVYTTDPVKPAHTVDRGHFHATSQVGGFYINFTYSDRPTTVMGTDVNTGNVWNLHIKKGWNRIAQVVTSIDPAIIEYTDIEPPEGIWFLY